MNGTGIPLHPAESHFPKVNPLHMPSKVSSIFFDTLAVAVSIKFVLTLIHPHWFVARSKIPLSTSIGVSIFADFRFSGLADNPEMF